MRYIQDSLQKELTNTVDQEKRYMLLRHLADISTTTHTDKFYFYRQLYDEACSAGDEPVEIEALLELANCGSIDSLCNYISLAERLSVHTATKGLLVLLKGQLEIINMRNCSEDERVERLTKLLEKYKAKREKEADIYDRILDLHILCVYLSYSIGKDMYTRYMEEEQELVNSLPPENYYLKSNLLVQLAILYTNQAQYVKAVETDKRLLQYIREREEVYRKQGRIYRNYYTFYYSIYRQMLSNYPALTRSEVDSCYDYLKKLCRLCPEARADFCESGSRSHLYYYMATKQYVRACPYIDSLLSKPDYTTIPRHILLQYKITISRALGQKEAELEAQRAYVEAIDGYVESRAKEKFKEMQVLYDVVRLNERTVHLELEKKDVERKSEHQAKLFITYIAGMLAALLVVLLLFHLRTRRLIGQLRNSEIALQRDKKSLMKIQEELVQARDEAEASSRMKTLFIQNMSHEIRTPLNAIVGFSQLLAEETKGKVEEYAELVFTNSELLLAIVNDLLQLADIEAGKLKIAITSCLLNDLCSSLLGSVRHRLKPEVELEFNSDRSDNYHLNTDVVRLQQILLNLLANAIKFTKKGRIELSYRVDEEHKRVIFAVTDTGPGVPLDKKEQIFGRFEKLDTFSQGSGLGLHICRLIAHMLKGEVVLDSNYTGGARFLFIHPII